MYTDSLDVKNLEHPLIYIQDSGSHCAGEPLYLKAKLSNYNGPIDWSWKIDQINVPYKTPEIQLGRPTTTQMFINFRSRQTTLKENDL